MIVERISNLKPWQIVTLGGVSVLTGLVTVGILAAVAYEMFPDSYGCVAIAHIIASGAAFFFIARPFIEGWLFRQLLGHWQDIRLRDFSKDEK